MPDNGRKAFGDIAPALAQYTDDVLFGDVWERPGLKPVPAASSPSPASFLFTGLTSCPFTSRRRLRMA